LLQVVARASTLVSCHQGLGGVIPKFEDFLPDGNISKPMTDVTVRHGKATLLGVDQVAPRDREDGPEIRPMRPDKHSAPLEMDRALLARHQNTHSAVAHNDDSLEATEHFMCGEENYSDDEELNHPLHPVQGFEQFEQGQGDRLSIRPQLGHRVSFLARNWLGQLLWRLAAFANVEGKLGHQSDLMPLYFFMRYPYIQVEGCNWQRSGC